MLDNQSGTESGPNHEENRMDYVQPDQRAEVQDIERVKDLDRAQYEAGVQSRVDGEPFDAKQSPGWQLGWERCRPPDVVEGE